MEFRARVCAEILTSMCIVIRVRSKMLEEMKLINLGQTVQ